MKILAIYFLVLFPIYTLSAQNGFTVSPLFGKDMVLQSGKTFQISGKGTAGDKINIEFKTDQNTIHKKAKVNRDGYWLADFPALSANMNCSFKFSNKSKVIEFGGVKTGDVWLIVGGSNTVHLLGNAVLFDEEKAKQDSSQFQYLIIPKSSALLPQTMPKPTGWKNHNPKNLPYTPSIAHYLGTTLAAKSNISFGIINCGFGGSVIESWMSAKDLNFSDEELSQQNKLTKRQHSKASIQKFAHHFSYDVLYDQLDEDRSMWSAPDFQDSNWDNTPVPETFEAKGLEAFDGVVWFRKDVLVPEGVELDEISMGYVDDSDEVYVNGKYVGGIEDGYGIRRIYKLPAKALKTGINTIAVRVRDIGGGGGIYGDENLFYLSGEGLSINISGDWKYRVEAIETDVDMNDIHRPGMLYNQMIHPLTHFPVKGIVWYQGEVEASVPSDFKDYSDKLKTLIKGYRREFNDDDLPFIIVQLPSFGESDSHEFKSWIDFKYAQSKVAKEMPNTEIISITDLINEKNNLDIHLSNHKATGERLANTVLSSFYSNKKGSLCPKLSELHVKNQGVELSFSNAQKLHTNDAYGYIRGFEIAGSDNLFFKVQATLIEDNKILLTSKDVTPVYIRYCGRANSVEGNVFNDVQMPLMPFFIEVK